LGKHLGLLVGVWVFWWPFYWAGWCTTADIVLSFTLHGLWLRWKSSFGWSLIEIIFILWSADLLVPLYSFT
jgi:hypothetical protein